MQAMKTRAGFALPLVIVFLVVMSFALAASLAATAAELGTSAAQRGQNRAYAVAEQALQRFLISRDSLCALTGSSCLSDPSAAGGGQDGVNLTIAGGKAIVVARQLRPQIGTKDTIPALYFVRAIGVDSTSRMRGGDTTNSVRAIGMMVQWSAQTMNVTGAWTSLSGLTKDGTAGQIDGNDQCGRKPAVAGVMVPKGDYSATGGFVPTGNPPLDTTKTLAQLDPLVTIDWNGILNGSALTFDFIVPQMAFPPQSWFEADTTRWPIIHVTSASFSLPNAGRGIIVADGDFIISGSNMWQGIILIGGQLTSNGDNTTAGATVSGLNYKLPGAVRPPPGYISDNSTANGNKTYVYNSCNIARATQRLRHYIPLPNTWIDDIPVW
jgi:hypothetical protein